MKKINIIKDSKEINKIINKKNTIKNKYYYIYKDRNNVNNTRFVICVSKKIGNAVRRNKVKRQIKDIIDKSNLRFKSNTDYVIIVSREINNINFSDMKESLIELFSKDLD
jgi:ribonuclease P protein component